MKTFSILIGSIVALIFIFRLAIFTIKIILKPRKQNDFDTQIISCFLLANSGNFLTQQTLNQFPDIQLQLSKEQITTLCHSALLMVMIFSAKMVWHDPAVTKSYEDRINKLFPDAMQNIIAMEIALPRDIVLQSDVKDKKLTYISYVADWLAVNLLRWKKPTEKSDILVRSIIRSLVASRV